MKHTYKVGCVVRMVVDSILPHAKSGPNDHRKDAFPFISWLATGEFATIVANPLVETIKI